MAQDVSGTVTSGSGGPVPAGQLVVRLDGAAAGSAAPPVDTNGKVAALPFVLAATTTGDGPHQVVAEVRGPDGRLIARGSGQFAAGQHVAIELWPVMY